MLIFFPVYRVELGTPRLPVTVPPLVAHILRGAEGLARHLVSLRPVPHDTDQSHDPTPPRARSMSRPRCTANPLSYPSATPTTPKAPQRPLVPQGNCSPSPTASTSTPFMRLWSECIPTIQALVQEHQHDHARVICNLAPLRRLPPVIARLAADLRSVAIEISQRRSFQDRYASDLQAALDVGEPRSGTTAKASFVPPPLYTPTPGPLVEE